MMNEQQKRSIRIALNFCRDRIEIPSRGQIDYADISKQIAQLSDAQRIRDCVKFVIDYEDYKES